MSFSFVYEYLFVLFVDCWEIKIAAKRRNFFRSKTRRGAENFFFHVKRSEAAEEKKYLFVNCERREARSNYLFVNCERREAAKNYLIVFCER